MEIRNRHLAMKITVNVFRLLLAVTFITSGFAKADDPYGTVYKLQDYLTALGITSVPELVLLVASIGLSFIEFVMGISMLFGISRRPTARLSAAFMTVMTLVTVYIFIFNPIEDCGCFGDAIILTNGQTLAKNIVLLIAAVVVTRWHTLLVEFISDNTKWLVSSISMIYLPAFAIYCIINLPVFDFRPYKIGTDMRTVLEGKEQGMEVKVIYEKDGKRIEISPDDDDPDETWKYVETRRTVINENLIKAADFAVLDEYGNDVTEDIIYNDGYTFLLVIPNLRKADEGCIDLVNEIYEYSKDNGYEFYCLTGSDDEKSQRYWTDHTGSEYPYYTADERLLKTIVRAAPGLVLMKDGKIIRKWSNHNLPDEYVLTDRLEKLPIGKITEDSTNAKIGNILLMFIVPLLILTVIDRTFAGWHFYKEMKKKSKELSLGEIDKRLKLEEIEKKLSSEMPTQRSKEE